MGTDRGNDIATERKFDSGPEPFADAQEKYAESRAQEEAEAEDYVPRAQEEGEEAEARYEAEAEQRLAEVVREMNEERRSEESSSE